MSIFLKKAGILTTVQDTGRTGFRRFGINPNGAMDRHAARLVNALLGNDDRRAVLETYYPAAEIVFEEPAVFAIGGADFEALLDDRPIGRWKIHAAEKGSVLRFTGRKFGNVAYFAVRGGFRLDEWLGSASTNLKAGFGGFEGRRLRNGDRLEFADSQSAFDRRSRRFNVSISNSLIPFYSAFPTVRVVAGAEFERLTAKSRKTLFEQNYKITPQSDRMGFRLAGRPLYLQEAKELVSSAVNFGTLQLLPDGQVIVLMADHQTTGGYPRLAHVIPTDLPLLAQLGAHDSVAFHLVSGLEAENLLLEFENDLSLLKIAARFLF